MANALFANHGGTQGKWPTLLPARVFRWAGLRLAIYTGVGLSGMMAAVGLSLIPGSPILTYLEPPTPPPPRASEPPVIAPSPISEPTPLGTTPKPGQFNIVMAEKPARPAEKPPPSRAATPLEIAMPVKADQMPRPDVGQTSLPETVKNPMFLNTGVLTAEGKTFVLDEIIGLGPPYTNQLQGYITAKGSDLNCLPRGNSQQYTCSFADGTDVAELALVNGIALAVAGARQSYRKQEDEALSNRRGVWLDVGTIAEEIISSSGTPVLVAAATRGDAFQNDAIMHSGQTTEQLFLSGTHLVPAPDPRLRLVQDKLIQQGYLKDKADGYLGPKTLAAISSFLRANGLTVTSLTFQQLLAELSSIQSNEGQNIRASHIAPAKPQ